MAKEEPKERILTEQEIRRLIENSEAPLRHIILVALNTGMRKSEILNLGWDQVNLEEGFIRIDRLMARLMGTGILFYKEQKRTG
jgi:integrase